jgi:hypothetical protein
MDDPGIIDGGITDIPGAENDAFRFVLANAECLPNDADSSVYLGTGYSDSTSCFQACTVTASIDSSANCDRFIFKELTQECWWYKGAECTRFRVERET